MVDPGETLYMDEDPLIKKTLEEHGFTLVVGPGEIDKQIKNGITVTDSDCRMQAEWSIDQRKYASFTLRYLNTLENYKDWTEDTLKLRPSFSKQDKQLIGLIELIGGTLQYYKKQGKGYPLIFIEEPETHLHPKEQREVMGLVLALKKELGS